VVRLEAALKRVVEADGYRDIIVDLADTQVVDMTGVSLLFRWSRFLRAFGVDLVLSGPSPSALEALKGSGLYEMFTITRT
jgi:anti-anti-sigma factor